MFGRGFRQEQRCDLSISGDRIAQHLQSFTLFSSDIGEFPAPIMWMGQIPDGYIEIMWNLLVARF
jgi:hypothetical protein